MILRLSLIAIIHQRERERERERREGGRGSNHTSEVIIDTTSSEREQPHK
jgi:hypothetical protein